MYHRLAVFSLAICNECGWHCVYRRASRTL